MISFRLVDLARLQGQLNVAQVRQNDMPLYQVVSQLISAVKQIQDTVNFNISTFSAGLNVSAGTSSRVVTQLIFSNQNSVSFGLSQNSITASANPGILFSASGSSGRFTGLTFSNSNGVTFGNSAGTITASINAAVTFSAGASSGSLNSVVFSNSNNISFGLNGSTITASASFATAQGSINFSVVGSSNNLASVVFSNANGVTFGLNGSVITGSVAAPIGAYTIKYFENIPIVQNINAFAVANNTGLLQLQPFNPQVAVSFQFIRGLWSNSWNNNSFGVTSANATWEVRQESTIGLVLYTLGQGASSQSLQSVMSTSCGITFRTRAQAAGVGSNWTMTIDMSHPISNTTTSFSTSYASTSAGYTIHQTAISQYTGAIMVDMPFSTSIPAAQWFVGYGFSTSTATSGNPNAPANSSVATCGFSSIGLSQTQFGIPFTTQTDRLQPGLGSWSTNVALISRDSINMSAISSRANNNAMLVQLIDRE